MPRVTRRSVAAQEESTSEESSRSTSRGRRSGAKKEEPKTEDVAIGEPQEVAPKRGGRQAKAKEPETKTPEKQGKSKPPARGRGRKGKDVEEKEEEEKETEEVEEKKEAEAAEEEKPQGRGGRSRGRGRGASATKNEVSTSRGSSRATRGKAANEEEDEGTEAEEKPKEESAASETPEAEKGRGARSRGRSKAETTPSPRAGRSSRRGRSAAEEKEEAMEDDVSQEAESTEKEKAVPEKANKKVKTPPKQVDVKTKNSPKEEEIRTEGKHKVLQEEAKEKEPAAEVQDKELPPEKVPSKEATPTKSASKEMQSKEASLTKTDIKAQEEVVEKEEPMETEDGETLKQSPQQPKIVTPTKKRKLEEEEEEVAAKKAKTNESVPSEEKDFSDFVVVNKDDVPAANSKEVLDCAPKLSESPKEPLPVNDTKPEPSPSTAQALPSDTAPPVPPEEKAEPVIVPLTEAELAKQYTKIQVDRDEASSTLVEVGSEGATDITGMSIASLDVSDAVSRDSTSTVDDGSGLLAPPSSAGFQPLTQRVGSSRDTPSEESVSESSVTEPAATQAESSAMAPQPPAPQRESNTPVAQQNNASAVAAAPSVNGAVSATVQSPPAPAVVEIAAPPAQPSPVAASTLTGSQIDSNGTDEPPSQKSSIQNPSPVKQPSSTALANYVPSSTAIDSRKFILNPAFPLELMDPAFCFSVVTYNILAECHWKRGDYSYTPEQYMELGYRHALMLKELDYLDGDIVCMQEVEPHYYKDTLLPAMTERGYSGWFMKRTKEHMNEGEATFVKNSRFTVKSSEGFSLKELAYKEVDESGLSAEVSAAVKEYLDCPDVLMLTQLECLKTGKSLTVANIHVVYAPRAPDLQCIQVACSIKQLVSKAGSDLSPHIICGDFNSKVTSASYQLAKDGYLSDDHIRSLQAVEALKNSDGPSRSVIHHMWRAFQHTSSNLKSAYEVAMGKEPAVTVCQKHPKGCSDYVFFSSASLDTVGVFETIDPLVLENRGGMPNANIPSDHLSLKAVFRVK